MSATLRTAFAFALGTVLLVVWQTQAFADGGMYGEKGGPADGAAAAAGPSTGTVVEHSPAGVTRAPQGGNPSITRTPACSVFANGSGMGSYCSSGTGVVLTLVERFADRSFDNCRYEDVPPGVNTPPNPAPGEKKWYLRTCLTNINWFTYDGGRDRKFTMDLVLHEATLDTTYRETELSRFLWSRVQSTYPVPMLQVEPSMIPRTGQRAYMTFRWLNTKSKQPERQGMYADDPDGGPYIETRNNGMLMRARARTIEIDTHIIGEEPFECEIDELRYYPDRDEQSSTCHFTFKRSSAQAAELSDRNIFESTGDAYGLELRVRWDVEYGTNPQNMRPLGNGFDMVLNQALPVRDSQAVNVPPFELGGIGD